MVSNVTVPVGANPTTEIDGAKVDGTATTFMRSDAVPALSDTGVTADTYGDSNKIPQISVDSKGRITGVSDINVETRPSQYTTKAGADVISWDYTTDGENIIVNLGSGFSNVLTVASATNFP